MQESAPFLYQEIAESLRRRIAAGELQAGDKLPPPCPPSPPLEA